jgi:type IV secretion system protein VirB2
MTQGIGRMDLKDLERSAGLTRAGWMMLACLLAVLGPDLALAQTSPFSTGAAAANTSILQILTPVAVIAVMALGVAAWFNRVSWGYAIAGCLGIVLVFGAQQIVTWVRGMFGV